MKDSASLPTFWLEAYMRSWPCRIRSRSCGESGPLSCVSTRYSKLAALAHLRALQPAFLMQHLKSHPESPPLTQF